MDRRERALFVARVVVMVGLLLYGIYYLLWRVLAGTVNLAAWYVAIPLIIVEAFAVYELALAIGRIQRAPPGRHVSAEEWERAVTLCSPDRDCPTVDVFIPTYDEPEEVMAQTVHAARDLDVPHETWILDDGKRDWLADLCRREGVHYLTRDDRTGFKAGNINHALAKTKGEFVACLDADFVALPDMIDTMLPYFDDPKVAIVQAPQAFYNVDSFQHSKDGAWNEQTYFFRTVLPAKARRGAVFWCGSPSILRRSAIEAVKGISARSVTEDIETSMALAGAGYEIAYHNQTVAVGLAPADVRSFMDQRFRWGKGAMQLLKTRRFNPITAPGLRFRQRLEFLESMTFWFHGFVFLMEYLVPPAVLLLGVSPIVFSIPAWQFYARWLPFVVTFVAGNYIAAPHTYRFFETSIFRTLYALIDLVTTQLFRRRAVFSVTRKGIGGRESYRRFLYAFRAMTALMIASLIYRLAVYEGVLPGETAGSGITFISAVFAFYFVILFSVAQDRVVEASTGRRRTYRHWLDPPIQGYLTPPEGPEQTLIHNLNTDGALLSLDKVSASELSPQAELPLLVPLPGGALPIRTSLRALTPGQDRVYLNVEFPRLSQDDEEAIADYLFAERAPAETRYDDVIRAPARAEAGARQ